MLQAVKKPHVRFSVETMPFTNKDGHTEYRDVDIVTIHPAGGKDEIVKEAEVWLRELKDKAHARNGFDAGAEFYGEWHESFSKMFKAFKEGQELPTDGTPIKHFKAFKPAQIMQCQVVGIQTLEDLSTANEETIQRIGMGGRALKELAATILEQQKGVDKAEENAALKMKVGELEEQIAELRALVAGQGTKPAREKKAA